MSAGRRSLAVVGGGIAGLAAAWEANRSGGGAVTLLEAADRLGGRIRSSEIDGLVVDEGADAFLARVPWGLELCREVGLEAELVAPASRDAFVYSRGALRPLPTQHVLGVPLDLDELDEHGVVSPEGVAEARRAVDGATAELADDAIAAVLRRQVGSEVAARLVDPLVGGINAGDTERLSFRAVVPQLAAPAEHAHGLVAGLRELRRAHPADPDAPVFHGLPGGTERLVSVLGRRLVAEGAVVRTGSPVTAVSPGRGGGFTLSVGATTEPIEADRVVLATAAPVTADLVAPHAVDSAAALRTIEHASVALVTLVVDRTAVGRPLHGSGFLVPRVEGLDVTACSWASSKWAHLATDDRVVLRASLGRASDAGVLDNDDDALVDIVRRDLAATMDLNGRTRAVRVSRWPRSFPQYAPGHLDLVDRVEADLADRMPGLAVAGWTYRGIGIPASIEAGRTAARRLLS